MFDSDGPNLEYCHPDETYARSKLLQISFSNELQRRLKAGAFVSRSRVTSNVINPGTTNTLFTSKDGGSEVKSRRLGFGPWRYIFMFFRNIFSYLPFSFPTFTLQRDVRHSANGIFHVATSSHLSNIGGKYFSDKNGAFVGCGLDYSSTNPGQPNLEEEDSDDDDDDEYKLVCGEGSHPPLGIDSQIGGKVWTESMKAIKKWL